ncbi:HAD-IA family hydrolase [Xanthobacter sp. V3C-3]|uniref:HAD-IA family hydrolase n=1 Tax=Xanthobacter lutulentifluminis TaxID=3119935 RepID=UPI00372B8441
MTADPAAVPSRSPALTLVLFDCDGTLVDSQHMIVAAMRDAHAAHGVALPERQRLLSVVGLSLPEAFRMLSQGDRAYPVAALVDAYRTAFTRLRNAEPPEPMFEDARDVLDALRRRDDVVLGMVTGKARRGVDRVLKAHDMEGWFSTIQTADDAPSKPHPAMVFQAMGEIGARPEETVVVGDTTYDISMALQAGASALGVAWGYHEVADLEQAGADRVVHRFRDVPDAIAELLARRRAPIGSQV